MFWIENDVPYSMIAYFPDPNGKEYRTDCSGYVSMSWNLSTSLTTTTLPTVSSPIDKEELKTGDILLKQRPSPGTYGHTLIFDKWANNEHTSYWAYEQHGPSGTPTVYRQIPYPYFNNDILYYPYRYNRVESHFF